MWKPYLDMIKLHCTGALNILDRFHIVAKLNLAIDVVRAGEARQLSRTAKPPVLKKVALVSASSVREPDRTPSASSLREVLRFNLRAYGPTSSKNNFPAILDYESTRMGRQIPGSCGAGRSCFAHRPLRNSLAQYATIETVLNYFRARKAFSSGIVED